MADDPTRQAILRLLARRGEVVPAGDMEHYAYLRHDGISSARIEGAPLTQREHEIVTRLSEAEVPSAVRWRVRDRMELCGPDEGRPDSAGVLAWLSEGWR